MADLENTNIQENNVTNEQKSNTSDLENLFTRLNENINKQMERYFTSDAKKEATNYGLTAEQMQEAAKEYLNKNKSKEVALSEENASLKGQIKSMKADSTLNSLFNKLEVNTDLKDDLLKMVNVNDFYDEKDELKVDELEKSFSSVITRIPGFKKVKETPNVNFGNTKPEQQTDHQKMKSLEEMAREMMGLNKKNNK